MVISGLSIFSLYFRTKMTEYHITPDRLTVEEYQKNLGMRHEEAEWRKFITCRISRTLSEQLYGLGTLHLEFFDGGGRKELCLENLKFADITELKKLISEREQENKEEEYMLLRRA